MQNAENGRTTRLPRPATNPTGVTVASILLPGLGQLINGQIGKGLGMMALCFVLYAFAWPLALLLCAVSAWDAHGIANTLNEELEASDEIAAKTAASQISSAYFVSQIEKITVLAKAGMLSAEEFSERKLKIIGLLESKAPIGSAEDFLTALIPLVQTEALTRVELRHVKGLLLS